MGPREARRRHPHSRPRDFGDHRNRPLLPLGGRPPLGPNPRRRRGHRGLIILSLLLLGAALGFPGLDTARGAIIISPATATQPLLFDDSFLTPPHTLNAAPANGWSTTLGAGGSFVEVRSADGFPSGPGLRVFEAGLGGRTSASSPVETTPTTANYSIGFVLEFSAFQSSIATWNTLFTLSNDQAQGSGDRRIIVINHEGRVGGGAFILALDTQYLFVMETTPGAGIGTVDVSVNASALDSSTTFPAMTLLFDDLATLTGSGTFSIDFTAGGFANFVVDWFAIDLVGYVDLPEETACEDVAYSTTLETDAEGEVRAVVSGAAWLSVAVATAGSSNATALVTVSGTPPTTGDVVVALIAHSSTGNRSMTWDLSVVTCGTGPVYGYSGITWGDPCAATYWDANTGRVKPIPCVDLLLAYDFETLNATGSLLDFASVLNPARNHSGELLGSPTPEPVDALFGAGYDFDGGGYVDVEDPTDDLLDRPDEWTIHLWLNVNDTAENRTVWAKWTTTDGTGWSLEVTGDDQVRVSFGGTNNVTFSPRVTRESDEPLTVVYDDRPGTTDLILLYLDGDLRDSESVEYDATSNAQSPFVGTPNATGAFFNGTLDELLIFGDAMNADQVDGLSRPFGARPFLTALEVPGDPTVDAWVALYPALFAFVAVSGFLLWFLWYGFNEIRDLIRGR